MRRLALILTLCLVLVPILTACGGGDPVTAEEVFPAARELIEQSVKVNTILLGDGPRVDSLAFGEYYYAAEDWEEEYKIHSVEDILNLTASVYTTAVYNVLYDSVITKDGVEPPDYQNRGKPATGLLVYTERQGWYKNTVHEYLFDTMTLTAATANAATVTLMVRITPEGYTPQEREISLNLLRTEVGWRCDKLTYVAYDYSSVN